MTDTIAAGDGELTPRQMRAAQRNFTLFSFLNVVSFHLLTGNLIALYALRLGAGDLLVGVLYSFIPLGQLVPLLGRLIVRRLGTVRTMGIFWIARYALMSPILLAPLFANNSAPVSIWLIAASVVGFNLARGVAITGHNAIVGAITTETERGSFLSRNQLVIHTAGIGAGLAIGLLLQEESPLFVYSLLMAAGIVIGLSSTRLVFRFPEPPAPDRAGGFLASLRRTLPRPGVPRFLTLLAVHSFAVSMVMPFLVVYAKRAHGLGDNTAMLLGAVGGAGAIAMALVSAFVIDRVGAKPLISLFTATLAVTTVMLAVAPPLGSVTAVWVYLGVVFFFATFGAAGATSANSVYYFNLTPSADRLNLGILYFLVVGHPGVAGLARRRAGARSPAVGPRTGDLGRIPGLLRRPCGGLRRHHHAGVAPRAARRLPGARPAGPVRVAARPARAGAAAPVEGQPLLRHRAIAGAPAWRCAVTAGRARPAAPPRFAPVRGALGGAGFARRHAGHR